MFKKMKKNPFLAAVFVLLLVIAGNGVYLLANTIALDLSNKEKTAILNKESQSYYTADAGTTNVSISVYNKNADNGILAKVDPSELGNYLFQNIYDVGLNLQVDEETVYGLNPELLQREVGVTGEGDTCGEGETYLDGKLVETIEEGCGPAYETYEDIKIKPYEELSNYYQLQTFADIAENEVVLSKKTAALLHIKAGDVLTLENGEKVTVKEVLDPNPEKKIINDIDFFEKFVDVPFILFGDQIANSLQQMYDEKPYEMDGYGNKKVWDDEPHANEQYYTRVIDRPNMESTFFFHTMEEAQNFINIWNEYYDGYMKAQYGEREIDEGSDFQASVDEFAEFYALDQNAPPFDISLMTENITIQNVSGTFMADYDYEGDADVLKQFWVYVVKIENKSNSPISLQVDDFKLKVNEDVLVSKEVIMKNGKPIVQNTTLPMTINPNSSERVQVIFDLTLSGEYQVDYEAFVEYDGKQTEFDKGGMRA